MNKVYLKKVADGGTDRLMAVNSKGEPLGPQTRTVVTSDIEGMTEVTVTFTVEGILDGEVNADVR